MCQLTVGNFTDGSFSIFTGSGIYSSNYPVGSQFLKNRFYRIIVFLFAYKRQKGTFHTS